MDTFFSSHMFQTLFYLSLKVSFIPYRAIISRLRVITNTKPSLTLFALRKMTESVKKTDFCQCSKAYPTQIKLHQVILQHY